MVRQASLSMEFSRHEYWSGSVVPSSRGSSQPKGEPASPALQVSSLLLSHWGKIMVLQNKKFSFFRSHFGASLVAQMVKRLSTMQDSRV